MTNAERLDFLIDFLQDERQQQKGDSMAPHAQDFMDKAQLFRALVNIRPPYPISEAFLEVQDAYLQNSIRERGVISLDLLQPVKKNMYLFQGDITTLAVDAIVNAANSQLLGCFIPCHACIDNVIHTFAGVQLRLACDKIMQEQGHEESTGNAKITAAYNLPSKHVIHTVGPIVYGDLTKEHEDLLAQAYYSCLECATKNNLTSIAFCCISTGEFRFPQKRAAEIALSCVELYLRKNKSTLNVIFNVFKDSDHAIYRSLLGTN